MGHMALIAGVTGLVAVGLTAYGWKKYFSPASKERRKRRRNYGKVTAKDKGLRIKLNVKRK